MKKQVISILLSLIMLLSIIPISSVLAAGTTSLVVTADKTTAYPDDTVNFTISIGAVEHLMGAEFKLVIPTGMTYVANSASVATGLRTTLGCASADWTESSMKFTMYGDGDYSSDDDIKVLTFSCKVNSDATGSVTPQVADIVLSNTKFEEISTQSICDAGTVTVTQRPISVTGVSLNKEILSLNDGESETLIATVSPDNATNNAVSWESSNTSVAIVDSNGKVTTIKKGTAIITATTDDGEFVATCVVSVACSHANTTVHPAKASSCTEQGNEEYVTCNDCGIIISGSDAKLPLADHTYIENVASQYLKSSATCNSKAVYYKSCSICGVKDTQTFEYGEYDSHNHIGETYIKDYKEATCFEEGYTGDTYCRGCNTKLIPGTAIQKNAHNPAAGWTTDNESHWKVCQTAGCGNISDKVAHTGGTATCKKKAVCEVCGVEYGTVNTANHVNTEKRNVVEATCTTDGYSGDTYCKDCGVKIVDGTVVPAGHKLTKVEEKKATHEADGNIAYYVCQGCGKLFADANAAKEIALKDTVIKKGEHSYNENYKSDAENHWKECDCGSTIEKAAHKFGEWKVTKEATTDTKGSRERVCSVCGYKAVEEIAAIVGNGEKTSPTTGDASNYTLWITLTFVSITGIGFMAVLGRKRREK